MKDNKAIFPLIIFLLIIFLPLTGYIVYYRYNLVKEGGNPEHKHKFDNKLYYYDSSNKLIGMYSCQSNICDDAITVIDDKDNLYYTKGNKNTLDIYNNYVFVNDNNIIKLYNLKNNNSILNLSLVKNYGTIIDGNYLIVKDTDNLYGILDLNNISIKIGRTYEYLALKDNYSGGNLKINSIIAKKSGFYYLININEEKLTSNFNYPIYDYNDKIVVCKNNNNYNMYYYDGSAILSYQTIEKINILSSFVIFQNSTGNIYIYSNDFSEIINSYTVQSSDDKLTYDINDNKIEIKNNGVLLDTKNV